MSVCAVYATFRVAVRKFKKNQHYKKSRTRKLFTDGNPVSQSPISSPSSFCACVLCFISQVETLAFLRQGIASACMIHFVSAPKSGKRIISRPFKDCNFFPLQIIQSTRSDPNSIREEQAGNYCSLLALNDGYRLVRAVYQMFSKQTLPQMEIRKHRQLMNPHDLADRILDPMPVLPVIKHYLSCPEASFAVLLPKDR